MQYLLEFFSFHAVALIIGTCYVTISVFLSLAGSSMPLYFVLIDLFILMQRDVVQTFN